MDEITVAEPILIPLAAAVLVPLVDLISTRLRIPFCLVAAVLTVLSLSRLMPVVFGGRTLVYWMGGWTPRDGLAVGLSITVDSWALLVALIVAVIGLLCLLYSVVYMRHETGRSSYYVLFMLLMAALIGFALSGDLFNQFVWLEVFSVAAFALTGFHYEERAAIEAAFKYLITNSIASLFIAIALSLLYMQTGALNLAHIAGELQGAQAEVIALGLLLAGYATKAALVPWHFWLPDAHTVAPGPVSAMFSGALIKIGIYAMARNLFTLAPTLFSSPLQNLLLWLAAISMVVGGFQMLQQQSIKRILAFSSVSQMGYALMGLALGTPLALAASAMHLIHHALVKSALFMGAGMITWRTNIHTLSEGGGLARQLPVSFAVFCLAGLSLSGMPFFSGYISKTMLEEAAFSANTAWIAYVAILASLLTFAGMGRLTWRVFWPRKEVPLQRDVREVPILALLPMIILVIGSLVLGTLPSWPVTNIAWSAARSLVESERYVASVMNPIVLEDMPTAEAHEEPAPNPTDWHHWLAPAIIALGGTILAYLTIERRELAGSAWLAPIREMARQMRRWHSGVVNDYALWTAFGTALMLAALVFMAR
jgi:multicomponent Na+:H+ antiporter subunit D